MNSDIDLELIRKLHPETEGSVEARDRARAVLLGAIADGERRGPHRARVRERFRLTLGPSLGLAAAAIAVVVVLIASGVSGGAGQPASAAAAILRRAARVATASGGPRQLRPGDYWYVHSRETVNSAIFAGRSGRPGHDLVIVDALTYYDRQDWIGVDKPGYFTSKIVGVKFLSAAARTQWQRDGRPAPLGGLSSSRPADGFDRPYKQLLALPTNVDALYKVVKGNTALRSAAWQRHEMFIVIGDLLRMDPVPARVRAALYLVAARIPGIRVVGLTHDALGRPALAIALNDTLYGERDELLFDPRTASLLGESSVVVAPGPKYHVKPGTVRTGSTYVTSGIVRHIGQRLR